MKLYIVAPLVFILATTSNKCKNKNEGSVYKGKLEVKGMCMNYTIKLLEGKIDTSNLWGNGKTKLLVKRITMSLH